MLQFLHLKKIVFFRRVFIVSKLKSIMTTAQSDYDSLKLRGLFLIPLMMIKSS